MSLTDLEAMLATRPDQATLQKLLNQAALARDGAAVARILTAARAQTQAFLVLDRYFFSPAFRDPELITTHPDYLSLWTDPALADFHSLRVEHGHGEGLPAIPAAAD